MKGKELEIDYLWDVGKGNEMKHEISLVLLKYSIRKNGTKYYLKNQYSKILNIFSENTGL